LAFFESAKINDFRLQFRDLRFNLTDFGVPLRVRLSALSLAALRGYRLNPSRSSPIGQNLYLLENRVTDGSKVPCTANSLTHRGTPNSTSCTIQ
jgi:hypothetical protein